jgi:hypothetical protein
LNGGQINIINVLRKKISLNPTHPISSHECLYNYEQWQTAGVFSTNKSYKLKTHLSSPLLFDGTWSVALVEADIVCTTSRTDAIYLYSDICGESIVKGERRPLLRRIPSSYVGNWRTVVEMPVYVPKKKQ